RQRLAFCLREGRENEWSTSDFCADCRVVGRERDDLMIMTPRDGGAFSSRGTGFPRPDSEPVELMLLLTRDQAATLEEAAHDRGLTVGQMLRHLVADFTSRHQVAEYWY